MKKLTKKQGIIAIVAVVLIAGIIGFSVAGNKKEDTPKTEQTDDKITAVDTEDIIESTDDYVVVNVSVLEELIGMKFVSGDDTTFTVTVDEKELVFTVGNNMYTIDGEEKEMKTSAVKNGDVYGIEVETVIKDLGHNVTISRVEGKVTDVIVTRNEDVVKKEESENNEDDKKDEPTETPTPDDTNVNTQPVEPVVEKVTMYAKSNVNVRSGAGTSNAKIGSLTKGQEIVKTGEENGWSKIEFNGGVGYVKSEYLSTEKVQVSTPNNQGNNQTSGNNTSDNSGTNNNTSSNNNQGSNNGGSTTSGMYSRLDAASKERLAKCTEILKGGIASQYIPVKQRENNVSYWEDEIFISAAVTNGAWMYVNIAGWSGQGIGAETEPIYAEIPSLTKQCLEAIAPQGGTELFNKINSLILQYGNEHNVPSQGTVSESIPGLSVTINDGVNGLEIFFWAE